MTRKYFGTDGVRGPVGSTPMTPDFALKLGWAAGRALAPSGCGRVLIGKDTRVSGYMFESALEAGFAAAGVDVLLVGVLPTPAIAYLTHTFRARAGVVISASHNPFYDNGVKFFSAEGRKISDEIEAEIERLLDAEIECVPSELIGRARRIASAQGRYVEFCKASFHSGLSLDGLHMVLDCANGAAYNVAPDVFSELGAHVTTIGVSPDGLNINQDVGSTSLSALCAAVREHGAEIGVALDGDADRCILVDAQGNVIDGDEILYILAKSRLADGTLKGPVVGTLMSNLGLELALRDLGIDFERANVGDRYVLERLQQTGGTLGGESSGHILCLDRTTTGDGTVSALQVIAAMTQSGKSLRELLAGMNKCPQVLINVPLNGKPAKTVMVMEEVSAAVSGSESVMGDTGRVLLRPSGTEPLIRVMVEGQDAVVVKHQAESIANVIHGLVA